MRLLSSSRGAEHYALNCEGLEAGDARKEPRQDSGNASDDDDYDSDEDDDDDDDGATDEDDEGYEGGSAKQGSPSRTTQRAFGMTTRTVYIPAFAGTQKINRLNVFPMSYYQNPTQLKAELVKRGRKWASLCGVYHVFYHGLGGRQTCNGYAKYNVSSALLLHSGNQKRELTWSCIGKLPYYDR